MKTLYISDMDGTLLGSDSLVSPRTASIISDLTRRGALITVATARTPATVVPLLSNTLTTPPAIVMTGVAQWQREPGVFTDVNYIPDNERRVIIETCHRSGIHPFIYTMDSPTFLSVYHDGDRLNKYEQTFYEDRRHLTLKRFLLNSKVPDDSRVVLCYAIGPHDQIFAAASELRQNCDLSISCYYDIFNHSVGHLEIFAPGVSKAAAVARLKEQIGAERTVVFGDNLNDLPMMGVADLSVAVGNAFEEVKENADIVIGPNTTDAVAKFIYDDYSNTI